MAYPAGNSPRIPEPLLRVSGIVATTGGLVTVDSANVGSQAPAALINGAGQNNFSKWFEVKGRYLTLLTGYTKGGETSVQFGFVVFGGDSWPQRDDDVTYGASGVVASGVNTDQKMSGTSYVLFESSMGGVQWVTNAFTSTLNRAIPVHFGVSNRTTPATIPVALDAACFPGRYARLIVIVAGTPNATTAVNVDLAWGD